MGFWSSVLNFDCSWVDALTRSFSQWHIIVLTAFSLTASAADFSSAPFFCLVSWLIFDICSPIYVCPIGLPRFYILPRNRGICSCFVWSKLVTFVTSCIIYGSSSDTAIGMISRSTAVLRHCSAHIRLVIATWLLYLLLLYLFLALVDSVSQRVSWPGSMWGEL